MTIKEYHDNTDHAAKHFIFTSQNTHIKKGEFVSSGKKDFNDLERLKKTQLASQMKV